MKKISIISLCFALIVAVVWWKMDSSNTAFRIGINLDKKPSENSRGIAGEGNHIPTNKMTDKQKELLKEQAIEKAKRNSKDQVMNYPNAKKKSE